MRCPECVKTNTRSSVRMVGGSSSDTFPALFWDGLGRSHMHTAEPGFVIYECAEGHRWREEEPPGPLEQAWLRRMRRHPSFRSSQSLAWRRDPWYRVARPVRGA